jgi:hypothetical protein
LEAFQDEKSGALEHLGSQEIRLFQRDKPELSVLDMEGITGYLRKRK